MTENQPIDQIEPIDPIDRIEREAAGWDARLRSRGCTAEDRIAFAEWLVAADEHEAAYGRLQAVLAALREASADPRLRAIRDGARMKVRQARRRRWTARTGIAAAVASLALGLAWVGGGPGGDLRLLQIRAAAEQAQVYHTDLNERSQVTLADGSEVTLDAQTRLLVRLSEGRRELDLLSGRARFDVAKDPARPFVVTAGRRSVTALGTVFAMAVEGRSATVTLVEGRVEVRDGRAREIVLAPRQRLAPEAEAAPVTVDVERALSWTEGRLFFEDEPLASAVAEMNRYSEQQIVIADPALDDLRINGMFRAGNQTGFVGALQTTLQVTARQDDRGRLIIEASE